MSMSKQLSNCCEAEIKLTGKDRPEAFSCEKCGRIIGTPMQTDEELIKKSLDKFDQFQSTYDIEGYSLRTELKAFIASELSLALSQQREQVREKIEKLRCETDPDKLSHDEVNLFLEGREMYNQAIDDVLEVIK